ncbi:hypothetical protein BJ742DRAFT_843099 [Cladochytrium replicatum]|nr:hypothetical protein BJ742DRAFT_843099 [Cladochytrium replicatum]
MLRVDLTGTRITNHSMLGRGVSPILGEPDELWEEWPDSGVQVPSNQDEHGPNQFGTGSMVENADGGSGNGFGSVVLNGSGSYKSFVEKNVSAKPMWAKKGKMKDMFGPLPLERLFVPPTVKEKADQGSSNRREIHDDSFVPPIIQTKSPAASSLRRSPPSSLLETTNDSVRSRKEDVYLDESILSDLVRSPSGIIRENVSGGMAMSDDRQQRDREDERFQPFHTSTRISSWTSFPSREPLPGQRVVSKANERLSRLFSDTESDDIRQKETRESGQDEKLQMRGPINLARLLAPDANLTLKNELRALFPDSNEAEEPLDAIDDSHVDRFVQEQSLTGVRFSDITTEILPEADAPSKPPYYPSNIDFLDDVYDVSDEQKISISNDHSKIDIAASENSGFGQSGAAQSSFFNGTSGILSDQQSRERFSGIDSSSIVSAQQSPARARKLITIRNLNKGGKDSLLSRMGQPKNMRFNKEKQIWEGNEDEVNYLSSMISSGKEDSFIQEDPVSMSMHESPTGGLDIEPQVCNLENQNICNEEYMSKPTVYDDRSFSGRQINVPQSLLDNLGNLAAHLDNIDSLLMLPEESLNTGDHQYANSSSFNPNNHYFELSNPALIETKSAFPIRSKITINEASSSSKSDLPSLGSHDSISKCSAPSKQNSDISQQNKLASNVQLLGHLLDVLKIRDEWAVTLQDLNLSDRSICSIEGLSDWAPHLKRLDLSNNMLMYLSGIPPNLTFLNLRNNRLSPLTSFSCLNHLEHLSIANNNLTDISALKCLIHLKTLDVSENVLDNASAEILSFLPSLVSINLNHNRLTELRCIKKDGFCALSSLSMCNNNVESLHWLTQLKKIQYIELRNNLICSIDLIESHKPLDHLDLSNNNIENVDGRFLEDIKVLCLGKNKVKRFMNEVNMKSLQVLILCNQKCAQSPNIVFANIPSLRFLDISGTSLKSLGLLSSNIHLEHLIAQECGIHHISRRFCKQIHGLQSLILSKNMIEDISILEKRSFSSGKQLKALDISCNNINNFRQFITIIKCMPQLVFLDFRSNPITLQFYNQCQTWRDVLKYPVAPDDYIAGNVVLNLFSDHSKEVVINDSDFQDQLSDMFFVQRACYRSCLINCLNSLEVLDGLPIFGLERVVAKQCLQRLKAKVQSLQIKESISDRQKVSLSQSSQNIHSSNEMQKKNRRSLHYLSPEISQHSQNRADVIDENTRANHPSPSHAGTSLLHVGKHFSGWEPVSVRISESNQLLQDDESRILLEYSAGQ